MLSTNVLGGLCSPGNLQAGLGHGFVIAAHVTASPQMAPLVAVRNALAPSNLAHAVTGTVCRAFFPLAGTLRSYPLQTYTGNATGAYQASGGPFAHSAECQRDQEGAMQLEVPPYAALGAFSVNIWFKANNASGPQYIFSQAAPEGVLASGAGPNQVSITNLSCNAN